MAEIRPLSADDALDELVALSRAFFAEYEAHHATFFLIDRLDEADVRAYFARWLDSDDRRALIALEEGRIVGYLTAYIAAQEPYWQVKRIGHISGLMVAATHRRQGIGQRLLAAAVSFFQTRGVACYTVYTAWANERARRFYERCGMTPLSITFLGEVGALTPAAADHELLILPHLPPELREQAGALLFEAFEPKMAPIKGRGDLGRRLVAASIVPEQFLAAMQDGRLVGLCGVSRTGCRCLRAPWQALAREYGWLRALPRWVALQVGHRAVPANALYVDQLAVAAKARQQGIGTRLLAEAERLARQQGHTRLVLDVVDTNPRARALYERLGYIAIKTQRAPLMRNWLGFAAVTTMALELEPRGQTRGR